MTEVQTPHLWLPYTQMQTTAVPLRAARTAGTRIILDDGRELIDAVSSWWTACHGYNHPHIIMAMEKQLQDMPHVMFGGLVHAPAERLASRLSAMLPGQLNRVFFADSGSVAVEVAMKMAVQYWINHGNVGRTRFLSFRDGYRRHTGGNVSHGPRRRDARIIQRLLTRADHRANPAGRASKAELHRLLSNHGHEIAGIIVEPLVQCAGGMKMYAPAVLKFIADAATEADVLLICDEVAVNFGRTGTLFAHSQSPIIPDIICLGKALTGGAINLAATVAKTDVFNAFLSENIDNALMHGPTYMGNPLACAAANASLDLFETEPRLRQVAAIEAQLMRAETGEPAGRRGLLKALLGLSKWKNFTTSNG